MKTPSFLNTLPLLALVALASLASCGKIRNLLGQMEKKSATSAASAPSTGAADIPKEIRGMLPGNPGRIVLVDFYADWCGPCRQLSPILEKIAGENPGTVQLCKVNVDQFRDLAAQQGVQGIPDVRIFVDGKLNSQFVGALPEPEVRKRIENLAKHLPPPPPPGDPATAPATPKEPSIQPMRKDWLPPGIQRR